MIRARNCVLSALILTLAPYTFARQAEHSDGIYDFISTERLEFSGKSLIKRLEADSLFGPMLCGEALTQIQKRTKTLDLPFHFIGGNTADRNNEISSVRFKYNHFDPMVLGLKLTELDSEKKRVDRSFLITPGGAVLGTVRNFSATRSAKAELSSETASTPMRVTAKLMDAQYASIPILISEELERVPPATRFDVQTEGAGELIRTALDRVFPKLIDWAKQDHVLHLAFEAKKNGYHEEREQEEERLKKQIESLPEYRAVKALLGDGDSLDTYGVNVGVTTPWKKDREIGGWVDNPNKSLIFLSDDRELETDFESIVPPHLHGTKNALLALSRAVNAMRERHRTNSSSEYFKRSLHPNFDSPSIQSYLRILGTCEAAMIGEKNKALGLRFYELRQELLTEIKKSDPKLIPAFIERRNYQREKEANPFPPYEAPGRGGTYVPPAR